MTVVYILHVLNRSGSIISFKNLLPELVNRRIRPIIIIPKDKNVDENIKKEFINAGYECFNCHVDKSALYTDRNILKRIYHNLPILPKIVMARWDLNRVIRKINPDIIHTISGITHEGYKVAKINNIPHVWHIREYLTLDFKKRLFPSQEAVNRMYGDSYTICISRDLQRYFRLDNNPKSKVIYNPVYSITQIEGTIEEKKNYFLISSRISIEKGIELIADAFVEYVAQHKGFVLYIAGYGPSQYVDYLKEKYKKSIQDGNIFFLGYVRDVRNLMKEARALFVGSNNEGFGRMTAEANMMGCPVIGRNSAGTKEILKLTNGGFLFDTHVQLVENISKICKMSQEEIKQMMKPAQKKAIELFNNESSAEKVYEFYKEIVSSHLS